MSAPLIPPRCVCQATPATDSTAAEHEKWCPSRKPTPERLAELKAGTGRPLMDGELEWLRGDANRSELHVIGARGGHWSLTDDLPGAVLELGRKLGAVVAELDRTRATLNQSENDLTGARLSPWEEEQDIRRLRVALESAKRGRSRARATYEYTEVNRQRWRTAAIEAERERDVLRKRVAELEAERHSTNEALSKADERVAELEAKRAAANEALEYGIRVPGASWPPDGVMDPTENRGEAEARLGRYRDPWPDASLAARVVTRGDWFEAPAETCGGAS